MGDIRRPAGSDIPAGRPVWGRHRDNWVACSTRRLRQRYSLSLDLPASPFVAECSSLSVAVVHIPMQLQGVGYVEICSSSTMQHT